MLQLSLTVTMLGGMNSRQGITQVKIKLKKANLRVNGEKLQLKPNVEIEFENSGPVKWLTLEFENQPGSFPAASILSIEISLDEPDTLAFELSTQGSPQWTNLSCKFQCY
jgi:hypothetical protein